MMDFLKLLGKGLLYIILLPLGIVGFAIYGLYLFIIFIIYFFKRIIYFFKGDKFDLNMPEDKKALEILNNARDFSSETPTNPASNTINYNMYNVHVHPDKKLGDASNNVIEEDDPSLIDTTKGQIENKEDNDDDKFN